MKEHQMVYPDWLRAVTRGKESALCSDDPVMAGISGGKTSGLMGFLLREHGPVDAYMGFRNTGREHSQAYLFLQRLEAAGFPIQWAEFRKPLTYGAPPSEFRYEIVTAATASRDGKPFEMFLETLAEFRAVQKGLPPVRPSGAMRLCTAYMKAKVANKIAEDLGHEAYTTFIGLRADEPGRVAKMSVRDTKAKTTRAPLAELGITNQHVKRFWVEQPFTLNCPENLGNCTLCFLKDEADLAHNMLHEVSSEERTWWIQIQDKYGAFKSGTDYEQLWREAPIREQIRKALMSGGSLISGVGFGEVPPCPEGFDPYRYKLLIRQEKRVCKEGIARISCNCEAAELLSDEYILDLEAAHA